MAYYSVLIILKQLIEKGFYVIDNVRLSKLFLCFIQI